MPGLLSRIWAACMVSNHQEDTSISCKIFNQVSSYFILAAIFFMPGSSSRSFNCCKCLFSVGNGIAYALSGLLQNEMDTILCWDTLYDFSPVVSISKAIKGESRISFNTPGMSSVITILSSGFPG